jgi:IS5 family transposase
VREHVRNPSQTLEYGVARRARNKIEALFSELRNQIRLRKLRMRGLLKAGEQSMLAATVQNIKRLVRFMTKSKEPEAAMA